MSAQVVEAVSRESASRSWAIEVAAASPLPVLILESSAERIIAASEPAIALLSGNGKRRVIGDTLASVTYRIPARDAGYALIRGLPGFPISRLVHLDGQVAAYQLWIRPVVPTQQSGPAFAVIAEVDDGRRQATSDLANQAVPTMAGSTDTRLMIDRINSDVASLLGVGPEEVLGTSILDLAPATEVRVLLDVLARATERGVGGSARLGLQRPDGDVVRARLAVAPLLPSPCFGFVAVADDGLATPFAGIELDDAFRRLSRLSGMVSASEVLDPAGRPRFAGEAELSARELEVVRLLRAGDRVPAIARRLYLSQSTVRNYLSSVFRKLEVRSQQELLDLIREP
ncbi:MAG TPA: LuxR C-terminal-related transcriptional regulator [Mycobacteriales bacterium]|nr:LuxR C-terminal-related transcriptional regulator [Mycobacteriales bacterium]